MSDLPISCKDCKFYCMDYLGLISCDALGYTKEIHIVRENPHLCGLDAKWFMPSTPNKETTHAMRSAKTTTHHPPECP